MSNTDLLGARLIDMKSIQPYSTRDEYLYAMKEDLAEWFNSMYGAELGARIDAETFVEQLENGVMICSHANSVMRFAVTRAHVFDPSDLQSAGILGSKSCLATPNGKGASWAGEFVLYRADAKPQSFQARDNIANFIRWCRFICKVRECLMFETEDLILRKNEKNFILCLLEVARYGSRFGVQVPTIVRMEQEIEAEIEREKSSAAAAAIEKKEEEIMVYIDASLPDLISKTCVSGPNKTISIVVEERELNSNGSYDEASSSVSEEEEADSINDSSSSNNHPELISASSGVDIEKSKSFSDSLENLNYSNVKLEISTTTNTASELTLVKTIEESARNQNNQSPSARTLDLDHDESLTSSKSEIKVEQANDAVGGCASPPSLIPSPLSTSMSSNSSINNEPTSQQIPEKTQQDMMPPPPTPAVHKPVARNLNELFFKKNNSIVNNVQIDSDIQRIEAYLNQTDKSTQLLKPAKNTSLRSRSNSRERSLEPAQVLTTPVHHQSQTNLHRHVCSIADRCTCEKQFPVVKIGEGKYRIGNTKNIVFIRILRNHIMVRVGGGWDTLENYLNKHDPCRCVSDSSSNHLHSGARQKANDPSSHEPNPPSNILLTPLSSTSAPIASSSQSVPQTQSGFKPAAAASTQCSTACSVHYRQQPAVAAAATTHPSSVDFTDAKLVIERNTDGKHIVGKILLNSNSNNNVTPSTSHHEVVVLPRSSSQANIGVVAPLKPSSEPAEMNGLIRNANNLLFSPTPNKAHKHAGKTPSGVSNSTSLNSIQPVYQSLQASSSVSSAKSVDLRSKMKKLINKLPVSTHSSPPPPPQSPSVNSSGGSVFRTSSKSISSASSVSSTHQPLKADETALRPANIYTDTVIPSRLNRPIYTETNLPPRLLRKYEKKRANTEALMTLQVFNHHDVVVDRAVPSMSSNQLTIQETAVDTTTNFDYLTSESASGIDSGSSNLDSPSTDPSPVEKPPEEKPSTSPQAPPRSKNKKYTKSKTADLSRFITDQQEFDTKPHLRRFSNEDEDEDDVDSLESSRNNKTGEDEEGEPQASSRKPSIDLNDSLESLSGGRRESAADILNPHEIDKLLMSLDTRTRNDQQQDMSSLLIVASKVQSDDNGSKVMRRTSLSSSSSLSNLVDGDPNEPAAASKTTGISKRAQWDKSMQDVNYKSQFLNSFQTPKKPSTTMSTTPAASAPKSRLVEPKSKPRPTGPPTVVAHLKANLTAETPTPAASKKARNLKLAKEQLYEMKRTIDAKVNLDRLESSRAPPPPPAIVATPIGKQIRQPVPVTAVRLENKPLSTVATSGQRTTPRKVKKRSGERSLTTGIIFDPNDISFDEPATPNQSRPSSAVRRPASKTPNYMQPLAKTRPASSSLHNLVTQLNTQQQQLRSMTPNASRLRRDSCASTASSATCLSSIGRSDGTSLCHPSPDYKENKAFELRKKSALMNKIILKSQLVNDPIFARANPIHQEIALVEQQQFMNDETINFITGTGTPSADTSMTSTNTVGARKRLFAKKNERNGSLFDPNASTASSTTSSSTTATAHNPAFSAFQPPSTGRDNRMPPSNSMNFNTASSPIQSASSPLAHNYHDSIRPSRSKSNCDLTFSERTNSTQDLVELMNNCVPPPADFDAFKRMTDECESLKLGKSTPRGKPRKMSRTTTEKIVPDETTPPHDSEKNKSNNSISSSSSSASGKCRRSCSVPSHVVDSLPGHPLDEIISGFVNLNCPEQAAFLK